GYLLPAPGAGRSASRSSPHVPDEPCCCGPVPVPQSCRKEVPHPVLRLRRSVREPGSETGVSRFDGASIPALFGLPHAELLIPISYSGARWRTPPTRRRWVSGGSVLPANGTHRDVGPLALQGLGGVFGE